MTTHPSPGAREIAERHVLDQFVWSMDEHGTIVHRDKRAALARDIQEYGERCAKPTPASPIPIPLPCPECEHAPSIKITVDQWTKPTGDLVSASIVCRDVEHQGKEWPVATAHIGDGSNTAKCLAKAIEEWNQYVEARKKP